MSANLNAVEQIWSRASGRCGKIAIAATVLCLAVGLLSADRNVPAPQSGNRPNGRHAQFEEEPCGLIGVKGVKPIGKKNGKAVYPCGLNHGWIPALSEIREAFAVKAVDDSLLPLRWIPPASDKEGRQQFCHSQRWLVNQKRELLRIQADTVRIEADGRKLDYDIKRHAAMERQHDYDMARASGLTLNQWDTCKRTPDAVCLDENGVYKGADGSAYQIDSSGFKWLLFKGDRIPIR